MKKIICMILILILFGFGCSKKDDTSQSATEQDTTRETATESADVRMVYFNVPPHVIYNAETGELSGAVYELVQNHIAPEMGVTFKWEDEPWTMPRQLETLKNNKGYSGAVFTYSDERAANYAYSAEPYFLSQTALIVQKDNPLEKVVVIDDILELTIGYAGDTLITPFMKDERLKWEMNNNPNFMEQNCEKVAKKRIDAMYAPDKAGLLTAVKAGGFEADVKLLDLPEQKARFHVAFSTGTVDLLERYNAAFKKIDASRVYLQILAKYLDVSRL